MKESHLLLPRACAPGECTLLHTERRGAPLFRDRFKSLKAMPDATTIDNYDYT